MKNKKQINDSGDEAFKQFIVENTLFNEIYKIHCRCCEDLYNDEAINIINRGMACKCGSWRIEVYEL